MTKLHMYQQDIVSKDISSCILIITKYTYLFYKKPVKGHTTESFESFLFDFLNFYIAERITLKAFLTSFIRYLLLTLFLAHRGLLGRIKKKTIIQSNGTKI